MNESTMREEWWTQQDKDDEWIKQQEEELQRHEAESNQPLLADGLEDALLGFGYQFSRKVAIYDYARCVEILERGGMSAEDAVEYMEHNVLGAYVGPNTSVFLTAPVKSRAKGKAKIDEVKQLALDFGGGQ